MYRWNMLLLMASLLNISLCSSSFTSAPCHVHQQPAPLRCSFCRLWMALHGGLRGFQARWSERMDVVCMVCWACGAWAGE
jgi:hypothetical protein